MLTTPKPKEPHQLIEWVKYNLRLNGITFTSLAKQHGGVSRTLVTRAFNRPSPKWEKIIADAMGKMPCELWPERYKGETVTVEPGKRKSTRKTVVTQ